MSVTSLFKNSAPTRNGSTSDWSDHTHGSGEGAIQQAAGAVGGAVQEVGSSGSGAHAGSSVFDVVKGIEKVQVSGIGNVVKEILTTDTHGTGHGAIEQAADGIGSAIHGTGSSNSGTHTTGSIFDVVSGIQEANSSSVADIGKAILTTDSHGSGQGALQEVGGAIGGAVKEILTTDAHLTAHTREYPGGGDLAHAVVEAAEQAVNEATNPKVLYASDHGDDVFGTDGAEVMFGSNEKDFLSGHGGDDGALGGAGDDVLSGGAGNDALWGGEGIDSIGGDADNDLLYGGANADIMNGGTGHDTFMYLSASESSLAEPDVIFEFNHDEGDKIDFSKLDARSDERGDQHFTFVDGPSEEAGTVWLHEEDDHWAVFANTDGGDPDMAINVYVAPGTQLSADDFIL